MKRGILLEIDERVYKEWKKRFLELGYNSMEEYLEELVCQDIEHDFCYNDKHEG